MATTRAARGLGGASWFSPRGVLGSSRGKLEGGFAPGGRETLRRGRGSRRAGPDERRRSLRVHGGASTGFGHRTERTVSPAPRSRKANPGQWLPARDRPAGAREPPRPRPVGGRHTWKSGSPGAGPTPWTRRDRPRPRPPEAGEAASAARLGVGSAVARGVGGRTRRARRFPQVRGASRKCLQRLGPLAPQRSRQGARTGGGRGGSQLGVTGNLWGFVRRRVPALARKLRDCRGGGSRQGPQRGPARQRALHPGGHPGQPRLVTAHTSFQDAPPSCTSRSPRAAVSLVAAGCPGRSSVWRGPGSADACPPSACPRCAAPGRLLHRSPQPRPLSGGVITPSTT